MGSKERGLSRVPDLVAKNDGHNLGMKAWEGIGIIASAQTIGPLLLLLLLLLLLFPAPDSQSLVQTLRFVTSQQQM
ncbi:hypothetical protein HJFPF1_07057 [Paramyrothecium foliicola]|nr:hypothetical protein HJFPF1_07057 [Paramyrothecium foliicola]